MQLNCAYLCTFWKKVRDHVNLPLCMHSSVHPSVDVSKRCWMSGKQCRPWSDATVCGIWSVYTVCSGLPVPTHRVITVYRIRPNYRTVRLSFSKLLGTLTCDKICIYLLRIHYKKMRKGHLMMIMRFFFPDFLYFLFKSICCGYSFELHRQVDAIQMSTHNICLYKEVKKKKTLAVIWIYGMTVRL